MYDNMKLMDDIANLEETELLSELDSNDKPQKRKKRIPKALQVEIRRRVEDIMTERRLQKLYCDPYEEALA